MDISEEAERTQRLIEGDVEMVTECRENAPSDYRLASRSPLMTIIIMSCGPFMAEFGAVCCSLVDAFWIGKVCGEDGLAAMSLSGLLDYLGLAFGMFLSVAASSQLAKLRGEKNTKEVARVFADLFRLCFICGAICPAILLPCVGPMLDFFGADGRIKRLGTEYLFGVLTGSVISCLNLFFCGVLQAEGRSVLYGVVQLAVCVLNGLVFDPLFMLVFKWETFGAGLAIICAEVVPMLIIAVLVFCGRFDTKVALGDLLRAPSHHTWEAVKTGFTQFVSHVCLYLPTFFSRTYVVGCAEASGKYAQTLAAFNVFTRLWYLPGSYAIAVSIGLLPAASYAMGANLPKRVLSLVGWSVLLTFIWCGSVEAVLFMMGRYVGILFGDGDEFLEMAKQIVRISFIFIFSLGSQYVVQTLLQVMQMNVQVVFFAILTQFLPAPVFGAILYYTSESKDVLRVVGMFACNDAFSLVASIAFVIWPIRKLRSMAKEQSELLENTGQSDEL